MDLCPPFLRMPSLRSKIDWKSTFLNKKRVLQKDCSADVPTCLSRFYILALRRRIPRTKTGSYSCFNSCSSVLLKYQFSSEVMHLEPSHVVIRHLKASIQVPSRAFSDIHVVLNSVPHIIFQAAAPKLGQWRPSIEYQSSSILSSTLSTLLHISKRSKRCDWTFVSIWFGVC